MSCHRFAANQVRLVLFVLAYNLELTRKALRYARIQTTAEIYSHLVQEDVDNGIRQLPGSEEYQERSLAEANEVRELAEASAKLPKEQRQALAKALTVSE